jgi:tetratricopeptide (TPR) repeat protein
LDQLASDMHAALALHQEGRLEEAITLYERLRAAAEPSADLLYLLGTACCQTGAFEVGIGYLRQVLALDGAYAPAALNLGAALNETGRYAEALEAYDRAISLGAEPAMSQLNRGVALQHLGRLQEALVAFGEAIRLEPGSAMARCNRGVVHAELGQAEAAMADYEAAIAIAPEFARARHNLAFLRQQGGKHAAAVAQCEAALKVEPGNASAWNILGMALLSLGRFDEALKAQTRAAELMPEVAEFHCNRGFALSMLRRFEEAVAEQDIALKQKPELHLAAVNKAIALLTLGRYAEGWPLFEARGLTDPEVMVGGLPEAKRWRGQPLAGRTILLHSEQGLGDTLQFCRYAPLLKAMGATVVLLVESPLVSLMRSAPGVDAVIDKARLNIPAYHWHAPLMSLPLALGTTLETIPADAPYLRADPERVRAWRERLGPRRRPRVGLCWATGHRPDRPVWTAVDQRRDVPPALLETLNGRDLDFVSLQKGERSERELKALLAGGWNGPALLDVSDGLSDFAETAALIETLDLVISVDTATAHLAGALGKPVWVLLKSDSCWRWLEGREASPWYPTARLFRQDRPGNWAGTMERVCAALEAFATGR